MPCFVAALPASGEVALKKNPAMSLSEAEKTFHKLLRANAHRHRAYSVFCDFCELSAIAISNAVDRLNFDVREARYLEIVGKYEREEVSRFQQMFYCVVDILEAGLCDCLGRLFMGMDFGDAGKGQFFTPYEVSSLMARVLLTDAPEMVERNGFITFNEPAVGAGGMVIAAADALLAAGINYQQAMHVVAVDIDLTACHMTFIQMALLHIPGVVVHGNALHPEVTWDEWITPAHILGGWDRRLAQQRAVDAMRLLLAGTPAEVDPPSSEPLAAAPSITVESISRKRAKQAEQMALF